MTRSRLAAVAGVGVHAVKALEDQTISPANPDIQAIARAFEAAGLLLIPDAGEGGAGVRLRASEWRS